MSMTSIGQDALVVYLKPRTPEPGYTWVAVIIHEGNVSEPIALPFAISRPMLASSGDHAYLAWVVSDGDNVSQEPRFFGVLLDRNAHPLEAVRELTLETGFVSDLSLTFDDAGAVFAYAHRSFRSSPRQLVVQRLAPIGAESPRVIFAEAITTSGIGIAASSTDSLLVAYPRYGQSGTSAGAAINRSAVPSRVMGRFVYLPSPGPS